MRRSLHSVMASVLLAIGLTVVPTSTANANQPPPAQVTPTAFAPENISAADLAQRRAKLAAMGVYPPARPKGAGKLQDWKGPYRLVSKASRGWCLDADLNTIDGNFTKVQMWSCSGPPNGSPSPQQLWWFWDLNSFDQRIVSAHAPNRTLEAYGGGGGNGTAIELYDWWNGPNQQWEPSKTDGFYFRMYNVQFPNMLLDQDSNCQFQNGCKVQLWQTVGGDNQYWWEVYP